MKKGISILLAAAMLAMTACGGSSATATTAAPAATTAAAAETKAAEAAPAAVKTVQEGKLVMCTNAEFPPYEYHDNNTIVGIDADMAQAVCDILGYELEISDMEFASIINAVQTGKADVGVAGMTITEDRLKNIDFTDPYTTATQVIIVRK